MARVLATLAALLPALCLAAPAAATVKEMGSAGTLPPGGTAFWSGPMVDRSGPGGPNLGVAQCDLAAYECFAYDLTVGAGGSRLRVAIDHPHLSDVFGLELRAPDGSTAAVASGSTVDGAPTYSAEAFVDAPAAGVWRAVAVAHSVSDSAFRMRAKLEAPGSAPASEPVRDLLPNLQANPPSRIGFGSCQEAEQAQHGAEVCLRFAQGPQNVGAGPLRLSVRDVGEPRDGSLRGTQYQVIERTDGTTYEVPAGEFEYHVDHGHYHHSGVGHFELLRVVDPGAGVMAPAGTGPKQGFCMDDYFIARWEAFDNAPARDLEGYVDPRLDCEVPVPGRTQMHLSAGWGDIYPEGVEGQYVEFGENGDGLYVIRVTTMPDRDVRESDHSDNAAYAYLRVAGGTEVTVLERGIGTSPWDPARVVVRDGRQPALDSDKTVPDVAPAATGDRPEPSPRPEARRSRTGGRFAFRLRLRRAGRLEVRAQGRGVVARARIRPRRRVRVSGVALPGRYTWRAGRSRGRFTVRDRGLALPAGRTVVLRVR